jgi:hypothetical protein
MRQRSLWRRAVLAVALLALVGTLGITLYAVVAGRVIEARVVSCGLNSCEVQWSYGATHGENSTEVAGATPGGFMKVDYVPGLGVTNRETAIEVLAIVPAVACIGAAKVLHKRRRSGHTSWGYPDIAGRPPISRRVVITRTLKN